MKKKNNGMDELDIDYAVFIPDECDISVRQKPLGLNL
jgi:hypothetical protein